MANIRVMGSVAVVNTSLKLEDIKLVMREKPDALTIYEGEEDNREPVFSIGLSRTRRGSISRYGAEFPKVAGLDGTPSITFDLPDLEGMDVVSIKEAVAKEVGKGIIHLSKLEETLPEVVEKLRDEEDDILMYITVE